MVQKNVTTSAVISLIGDRNKSQHESPSHNIFFQHIGFGLENTPQCATQLSDAVKCDRRLMEHGSHKVIYHDG